MEQMNDVGTPDENQPPDAGADVQPTESPAASEDDADPPPRRRKCARQRRLTEFARR